MRVALALLVLVGAACGEGGRSGDVSDAGGETDAAAAPIHFAEVRSAYLMSCGLVSCHRFAAAHNAGLAIHNSIPDATLYASLVNARTGTVAERPPTNVEYRVVPFRPRESFLLWKLTGHDPDDPTTPVAGARMPLGGPRYLSESDLGVVRTWIAQGALP